MAELADYLDLTVGRGQQFRELMQRSPTASARLEIQLAPSLADAIRGDQLTRQYYGRPPLLETLLLPDGAQQPACKYLDWHRENIFAA